MDRLDALEDNHFKATEDRLNMQLSYWFDQVKKIFHLLLEFLMKYWRLLNSTNMNMECGRRLREISKQKNGKGDNRLRKPQHISISR